MSLVNFNYKTFSLDLKSPLQTGKGKLSHKKGFIIELFQGSCIGLGEASNIPGYSLETASQIENDLKKIASVFPLVQQVFLENPYDFLRELNLKTSAVYCGFELALLNFKSCHYQMKLIDLLPVITTDKVPINSILKHHLSLKELDKQILSQKNQNLSTFKIKVSKLDPLENKAIKNLLTLASEHKVKFRLDCNAAFDFNQSLEFFSSLPKENIQYIEEPFKNPEPSKIAQFKKQSGHKLALDESLMQSKVLNSSLANLPDENPDFFILKPMCLNGIKNSLKIANQAKKLGIQTVFSNLLESSIGRFGVFLTALGNPSPNYASGIGTGALFKNDLGPELFEVKNGFAFLKNNGLSNANS